jgi:hypothetical protein
MVWFPILVMLLGSPLVLLSLLAFDTLVLIESERHIEDWNADGKPFTAFRNRARFSRGIRNILATHRCWFVWSFRTPSWAREDTEAARELQRMRLCAALWSLVAMPLFLLAAMIAIARS